jgi:hypothetical protein
MRSVFDFSPENAKIADCLGGAREIRNRGVARNLSEGKAGRVLEEKSVVEIAGVVRRVSSLSVRYDA